MPPRNPRQTSGHTGKARRSRRIPLDAVLQKVSLRDYERGRLNLAAISGRVSAGVMAALPSLLAESPDPDTALNGFERFTAAASPQILRMLDRTPRLIHYALAVFGYSAYLGDTIVQHPDILASFLKDSDIERSWSAEEYRLAFSSFQKSQRDIEPSLLMARFRRRQYVRIMLRDVLGIATLAEATAELSALADALIGEALAFTLQQAGARYENEDREIAVISLGKLGGSELNYSSDIDLLFLYSAASGVTRGDISPREFYIQLAQRTTEMLSRLTPEGPVYRVDLRLRPRGAEGEPAVSLSHALSYYAQEAHDWELQAMIKARHSAGAEALTHEFLGRIQPHVYRAQLNFAAIETALKTRRKMSQRKAGGLWARTRPAGIDVKVDRGGIRDIEFLAQCLQRVYGGTEAWLRSRGTLFALQKLHDKGHLSGRDYHELSSAYVFLRTVEHRLQLRQGQQTHRIPQDEQSIRVLGRSVAAWLGERPPEAVPELVLERMNAVSAIYTRIVHQRAAVAAKANVLAPQAPLEGGAAGSFQQLLQRLASDSPQIHGIVAQEKVSGHGRRNVFRYFSSAMTSAERYNKVLQHPVGLQRALELFDTSDFLADVLVNHPEEIAALEGDADCDVAASVGKAEHGGSVEARLATLRRLYRRCTFQNAARDLIEHRLVYAALAASSAAAEETIRAVCHAIGAPGGVAVMALGRLGTQEFDYGSDADLIFIRDARLESSDAANSATEIVRALGAYTREGTLFSVDTRLRPRGNEGELVVSAGQLSDYFLHEAQAWEALSYTKLRYIYGDQQLAQESIEAVRGHFPHVASSPQFVEQLRDMRSRLEAKETEHVPNFKTSAGAIYDIDFVAGALLVVNGMDGERGNLAVTLQQLVRRGLLPLEYARTLERGAEMLRTLDHVTRLVTGRARKWLPAAERARAMILRISADVLHSDVDAFESELRSTMRAVRDLFNEVLPRITAGVLRPS